MKLLGSMTIAFSMYFRMPVSQAEWAKERVRYATCFFSLAGAAQGTLLYVFALLAWKWEFRMFYYVGGMALPILVDGGAHMDGFLDVVDAKASFEGREKKLETLKDPHVGFLTIFGAIVCMPLYLGISVELPVVPLPTVGSIYMLTRTMSSLSAVWFPEAKNSGLAAALSEDAQKKTVAVTTFLFMAASLCFILRIVSTAAGILYVLAVLAVCAYYYRISVKEFDDIIGDLVGYFLQAYESVLMVVLAISLQI